MSINVWGFRVVSYQAQVGRVRNVKMYADLKYGPKRHRRRVAEDLSEGVPGNSDPGSRVPRRTRESGEDPEGPVRGRGELRNRGVVLSSGPQSKVGYRRGLPLERGRPSFPSYHPW